MSTDSEPSPPDSIEGWSVLLLRQHSSQSIERTLEALYVQKFRLARLILLLEVGSELSESESRTILTLGLKVITKTIEPGAFAEAVNQLVAEDETESFFLCLKAGDWPQLKPGGDSQSLLTDLQMPGLRYCMTRRVSDARCMSGLHNPVDHLTKKDYPVACVWSGLMVSRSFLASMGGFNVHYTAVPELELWMRCYLKASSTLRLESRLEVLVEPAAPDWLFRFGSRWVVEVSNLYYKLTGTARPQDFLYFAHEISKVSMARPWVQASTMERLSALAYSILYWIAPAERHALIPYLQLSHEAGQLSSELRAVSQALGKLPNWLDIDLKQAFLPRVRFYSAGAYCQSAQVLKDITLRSKGPLDWIFSSPRAVAHMLSDRFNALLDSRQIQVVDDADKDDPLANQCDHRFYRDQFGVRFMFNHHNPTEKIDLDYFKSMTAGLLDTLDQKKPAVFLYVDNLERPAPGSLPIWEGLSSFPGPKGLVCVQFRPVPADLLLNEPITIGLDPGAPVLHLELPVASQTNGLQFKADRDNRRFRFLVFHALLWMQHVLIRDGGH